MFTTDDDERFMRRAIELTSQAPTLPFGAVIVHRRTGQVVAEGWNRTDENPTWHGEMDALNALARAGHRIDGRDLILYTTAEPCPMCMGAILWCGVGKVVFGASIRFLLDTGWRQIAITAEEIARRSGGLTCEVVGGILEDECKELFLAVSRAAPGW